MSRGLANSWRGLGAEQRAAAGVLRARELHRPSVSRAYYAAYSLLTAEMVEAGYSSFGKFKNPDHASLPLLVRNHLSRLSTAERRSASAAVRQLRSRREDADYRPQVSVGKDSSRESMVDLEIIRRAIGGKPQ